MSKRDDYLDDDVARRRRLRRVAAQQRRLIAIIGVGCVLVLAVGGLLAVFAARSVVGQPAVGGVAAAIVAPAVTVEPGKWTHQDVLDRLLAAGLKARMEPTHVGGFHGPAADFHVDGLGVAYVQKRASAQDAKDQAALDGKRNAVAWGPFYIRGDRDAVTAIRNALP